MVEGKKDGRTLGYPTANIILEEKIPSGIYSGKTIVAGKQYLGAVFINPDRNLFEIHILDFSGDLYGQKLNVELGEKIREIQKFDNIEDLKKQIGEDVERVRKIN